MRMLVVSHSAVTPVNQALFARVAARTGWDVQLVVPRTWRNEYGRIEADRWHEFHGELHRLPVVFRGNIPLHVYAKSLSRVLRHVSPDVVYVHHEPYALATAQVLVGARQFRGGFGFHSCQNIAKRYPLPFARLEQAVYRRADFAFPATESVLAVLRSKGYAGNATVLPFSVDADLFRPAPASGPRPLTAGFVGRLVPEKGVDLLLAALREVPEARAVIVGDGPAAPVLRQQAAVLGVADRVDWRGYVPHEDVAAVYQEIDVLALPSRPIRGWSEQFGRVVIEALASGVPVIASDSGELPRLLGETGGGWTFCAGDAKSFAAALCTAANPQERRARGERGRRVVTERYTLERAADAFAAALLGATAPETREPPLAEGAG